MPTTTIAGPAPATSGQTDSSTPQALVPFTRAAKEHSEIFVDITSTLGASTIVVPPQDVVAYGFVRAIVLDVIVTSTGNAATVALSEDAPWNIFQELAVFDVNGAPLYGPIDGFSAYVVHRMGGVRGMNEPKLLPYFVALTTGAGATAGSGRFQLRIPIEINGRTALGALANANSSSTYKLRMTHNPLATIFSTPPNGTVTCRVRATLEAWWQPAPQDWRGRPVEQLPPAHGTTGYWTRYVPSTLPSGQNTVRLNRVGNYIRQLAFIFRNGGTTRSTGETNLPDPVQLYLDTRLLHSLQPGVQRMLEAERGFYTTQTFDAANGPLNGVFVFDFCHEFNGQRGFEMNDGWLPTLQSSRLELVGSFGVSGSLTILTNDVAPAGGVAL